MKIPLRAVIADDEPLSLRRLELGLGYIAGVQVVGSARNAEEARELIHSQKPNLTLLDIKMPGASGVDLAAELKGHNAPVVIFVTAHSQYAVRAFSLAAADYVLKPLDFNRLTEAVERARERIASREDSSLLAEATAARASLQDHGDNECPYERELWIDDRQGRLRVPVHQIVWFEAERDYVRVHTSERSYLARGALRAISDRLDPSQFLRLHRSALVNSGKIARVARRQGGGFTAVLATHVEVPIGRKYQRAVKEYLGL